MLGASRGGSSIIEAHSALLGRPLGRLALILRGLRHTSRLNRRLDLIITRKDKFIGAIFLLGELPS